MAFKKLGIFLLVALFCSSCSKDGFELYHVQEGIDQHSTLVKITHPQNKSTPFYLSQEIGYDELGRINYINVNESDQVIDISYSNDSIVGFVRHGLKMKTLRCDTVYYILNNRGWVKYAIFALQKVENQVIGGIESNRVDSAIYKYSPSGYLEYMSIYSTDISGKSIEIYSQNFITSDGNITEIILKNGDHYRYKYDDKKHDKLSELCYDMPKMLQQFPVENPMVLMLPAIYGYLGTKNKNNVTKIDYEWNKTNPTSDVAYSEMAYSYKYEKEKLSEIQITGKYLRSGEKYDGGITKFYYSK